MQAKPGHIVCAICGHQDVILVDHVLEAHGLTDLGYEAAHPGAPVVSQALWDEFTTRSPNRRRSGPPGLGELRADFAGFQVGVRADVPLEACLPMPANYGFPKHGELAKDVSHATVSLMRGRSVYVWGMPGSGKDAFMHAYSSLTRTPAILLSVQPGTDVQAWLYSRAFDAEGTKWEEGLLLKALRDGYVTTTGKRIPMMVLISDFDRADRSQAEILRLILDSIAGRVPGPAGVTYPVLPGTIFAFTANTMGGGDERGRMISANPIDASLLDRINAKFQFHWMDWLDEEPICREKFPLLQERCPGVFAQVGKATEKIREAIHAESVYCEWSHRAVCNWLLHAEDLVFAHGGKVPRNLLKRAAKAVIEGLPDTETRGAVRRIMDPHVPGGTLNQGSTDHIREDALDPGF